MRVSNALLYALGLSWMVPRRPITWVIAVFALAPASATDKSKLPVPPATLQSRHRNLIVGGHEAKTRYPYFSALTYKYGVREANHVILNGALIAPDFVLTAGHCIVNGPEVMTIKIGIHSMSHDTPDAYESSQVTRAIRHPLWNEFHPEYFSHDFLLLQLETPATTMHQDHHYQPIPINRDPEFPKEGQDVLIMGLGWINGTYKSPSDVLQETVLSTMSNVACDQSHDPARNLSYAGLIDSTMMCTSGGPHNDRDGCAWDSGAPIVANVSSSVNTTTTGEDQGVLVALGSWGVECADPFFPGVQARVSAVSDWIDDVVCSLSVDPPADFDCTGRDHEPNASALVLTDLLTMTDNSRNTSDNVSVNRTNLMSSTWVVCLLAVTSFGAAIGVLVKLSLRRRRHDGYDELDRN